MNQKGVLTAWSDDKGFGFITPEAGGERVFAHISVYAGRGRPVLLCCAFSLFWLAVLANLGALGWLMVAPEAMSLRQQLGFDLSRSLAFDLDLFWGTKSWTL